MLVTSFSKKPVPELNASTNFRNCVSRSLLGKKRWERSLNRLDERFCLIRITVIEYVVVDKVERGGNARDMRRLKVLPTCFYDSHDFVALYSRDVHDFRDFRWMLTIFLYCSHYFFD